MSLFQPSAEMRSFQEKYHPSAEIRSLQEKYCWDYRWNFRGNPKEKRPDAAARLFKAGASVAEVSKIMSIDQVLVRKYLRGHGLAVRYEGNRNTYLETLVRRWERLVPREIAERQAKWELCEAVCRAISLGEKKAHIAKRIGVSRSRIDYYELFNQKRVANNLEWPVTRFLAKKDSVPIRNRAKLQLLEKEKRERELLAKLKAKYEN